MSRYFSALISSLVLFVLIGCGGGNSSVDKPTKNTPQEQTPSATASVNTAPVATFSTFKINKDVAYDGQLTATDADGDTLKYIIVTQPQHGSVEIHDNGCFTYTPDAGYQGSDTFSYKASDDVSSCAVKTVTIDVCQPTVAIPTAPTNLTIKALSSTKLELTWSDNSDNEEGFAIYQDGKLVASACENETQKVICCGLEAGKTYTFEVRAKNEAGNSAPATAQGTTKDVTTAPNAPTELKATAIEETTLRLTWKDNADNESGYEVYQDGVKVKTVSAGCHCAVISGLSSGTSYGFVVKAVNRLGSGDSEELSVKTEGGESVSKSLPYDEAHVKGDIGKVDNQSYITSSILTELALRTLVNKYSSLRIVGYSDTQNGLLVEYNKDSFESKKALKNINIEKGISSVFTRILNPFANSNMHLSKENGQKWDLDIDELHKKYTYGSPLIKIGVLDGIFGTTDGEDSDKIIIHNDLEERLGEIIYRDTDYTSKDLKKWIDDQYKKLVDEGAFNDTKWCKDRATLHAIDSMMSHGTLCAGVIGAKKNSEENNQGINEVSPLSLYSARSKKYSEYFIGYEDYFDKFSKNHILSTSLGARDRKRTCDDNPSLSASPIHPIFFNGIKYIHDKDTLDKFKQRAKEIRNYFSIGNGKKVLYVKSAGNEYEDAKHGGGAIHYNENDKLDKLDNVIVVAALENNSKLVDYSDYGKSIDIAAPTRVRTTSYSFENPKNHYDSNFTGTSASAPIVSGVASLIFSLNPNFTAKQVKEILIGSANSYVIKRVPNNKNKLIGVDINPKVDIDPIPILNAEAALALAKSRMEGKEVEVLRSIPNQFDPTLILTVGTDYEVLSSSWKITFGDTSLELDGVDGKITIDSLDTISSSNWIVSVSGKIKLPTGVIIDYKSQDNFEIHAMTLEVVNSSNTNLALPNTEITIQSSTQLMPFSKTDENGKLKAYFIPDSYKVFAELDGYINTMKSFKTESNGNIKIPMPPTDANNAGTIQGIVFDTDAYANGVAGVVVGATVTLVGTSFSTVTDENGEYSLSGVPKNVSQVYQLKAEKVGYSSYPKEVIIPDSLNVEKNFYFDKVEEEETTPPDPINFTKNITVNIDDLYIRSKTIKLNDLVSTGTSTNDFIKHKIITNPSHGQLGDIRLYEVIYTPNVKNGTDSFTFQATNRDSGAIVTVTVNIKIEFIEKKYLSFSGKTLADNTTVQRGTTKSQVWTFTNFGNTLMKDVQIVPIGTPNTGITVGLSSQKEDLPSLYAREFRAVIQIANNAPAGTYEQNFKLVDSEGTLKYASGNSVDNLHYQIIVPKSNELDSYAERLSANIAPNEDINLNMGIRDGNPPYSITIDWNDGSSVQTLNKSQDFTAGESHTYTTAGDYTIAITMTDAMEKISTYTMPIKVMAGSSMVRDWTVNGRDLKNGQDQLNIAPQIVNQGNFASYTTNWTPSQASDDYWVTYSLAVPSNFISLDKKMRVTLVSKTGQLHSHDRAITLSSSDKKSYTFNMLSNIDGEKGFTRIKDHTTGANTKKEVDGLTYNWIDTAGTSKTFAVESMGTRDSIAAFNVTSGTTYTEIDHTAETMYHNGEYLKQIAINFKGNGKIELVAIEYDKNGNGSYEANEKLVLSTQDMKVDWSVFGDGEPVDKDYTRNHSTQIVTDNKTGLMWQDDEAAKKTWLTWTPAKTYCSNEVSLGGHNDWRLPTIDELKGLVDTGESNFINKEFKNTTDSSYPEAAYWSMTAESLGSNYPYYYTVDFKTGNVDNEVSEYGILFRCVRSDSNTQPTENFQKTKKYLYQEDGSLSFVEYKYFLNGKLVKEENDFDDDGIMDARIYYNSTTGETERIERDFDDDGVIDDVVNYEDGVIVE